MKTYSFIKPWPIIIIILIIIATPFITNELLLIPKISSIVGDNRDWLQFYGSYIGAIVGAIATIFVFIKTINYYRKQDIYQHEMDMLDKFREIASDYVETYNPNHIQTIIHKMYEDPQQAYYDCGLHINYCMKQDIRISFVIKEFHDSDLTLLFNTKLDTHKQSYRELFNDTQKVLCEVSNAYKQSKTMSQYIYINELTKHNLSDEFCSYLVEHSLKDVIYLNKLHDVLLDWLTAQYEKWQYYLYMSNTIENYISDKSKAIKKEYDKNS